MSKKDYELIAAAIKRMRERDNRNAETSDYKLGYIDGVEFVADEIATALEGANSLFNRIRFLDACGVK